MQYGEVERLASEYAAALRAELELSTEAVNVQAGLERLETRIVEKATAAGQIDGKNADTRKAQRAAVIAASSKVTEAHKLVKQAQRAAAMADIECRRLAALIGLTKAWLRSQAGE